jgi:protein-S-isoprenylcysteine O-methyltransferase Ste14
MIDFMSADNVFEIVIALCWGVLIVAWALSALFVKRTIERSPERAWLWTLVPLMVVFAIVRRAAGLRQILWPQTAVVGTLADLLTIAGLVVALWARATLGRNWSGRVVFKEDHELIQRGPYAHVRHPIYSGILLMGLGTAIASARLSGFLLLAATTAALAIKWRTEERLMTRHFPEAYPEYRRRVKALIPGVW